ncbi:MAG TPA: hypothetical protein VEG42_00770 [Thermoplasmata archaeon]|nr:hypothetical protein [Thermoplasmata archaeon]
MDGEAEGLSPAMELVGLHRPALLVVDASLAEGSPAPLIGQARALVPGIRVILVAPASRPPNLAANPAQRPDALLLRPFRIRQFAEALVPPGPTPPTPPTG